MNIVLGITGSISAYKTPWLVRDLQRAGFDVRVVATPSATEFVSRLALEATSRSPIVVDPYSATIQDRGSWHVHMAHWANAMLIAPCSATSLARLAHGLCDTAVMTVALSLPANVPLLVAPAMDLEMWQSPVTQHNITVLRERGIVVIPPAEGELASGLSGVGRLPELDTLVHAARKAVTPQTLSGTHVVVTAGPTHEAIDAVRFIANASSGTMGYALAEQASLRGASVTLVSGPTLIPTPLGVDVVRVTSAADMASAVLSYHSKADVVIMSAAVADFTPANPYEGKLKKHSLGESPTIQLTSTLDILSSLGESKSSGQTLVGFALEHSNVVANAQQKCTAKNADIIVANAVGVADSGFGGTKNTITLVSRNSEPIPYPAMTKHECANIILDAVEQLRRTEPTS